TGVQGSVRVGQRRGTDPGKPGTISKVVVEGIPGPIQAFLDGPTPDRRRAAGDREPAIERFPTGRTEEGPGLSGPALGTELLFENPVVVEIGADRYRRQPGKVQSEPGPEKTVRGTAPPIELNQNCVCRTPGDECGVGVLLAVP